MEQSEIGYRGPQACKIVDITYRQLDYWTRTGLVSPTVQPAKGSGTQRLYSFNDLLQLKVIKGLTDAGASLQKVRQAIDYVRENTGG
jgi:DNA-binding transcriptional MerR regulator